MLSLLPTTEPWYDTAATIATLIAALGAVGAIVVGIFTVRQRATSDARAQWWSRVQWAVDLSFEEERARRTVGFEALTLLAQSPLAGPQDLLFLEGLSVGVLTGVGARGTDGPFEVVDEPQPPDRVTSRHRTGMAVTRDEVAAAQLRTVIDDALGRPVPSWLEELARAGRPDGPRITPAP